MARLPPPPPVTFNGPFYAVTEKGRLHLYPHVCFHCRSCFRRPVLNEGFERPCPRCARPAIPLWTKFKPPPRDDAKQWQKVTTLVRCGFFFLPAGRGYPATLGEVAGFVAENRGFAEGWRTRWPEYSAATTRALEGLGD